MYCIHPKIQGAPPQSLSLVYQYFLCCQTMYPSHVVIIFHYPVSGNMDNRLANPAQYVPFHPAHKYCRQNTVTLPVYTVLSGIPVFSPPYDTRQDA